MMIRNVLLTVAAFFSLMLPATAHQPEGEESTEAFVNTQLNYCHLQVCRALTELRGADGMHDFTMMPRNILAEDRQLGWNCRKASAEEWCSGFWPGILWMDYAYSHDPQIRHAAERYTESLNFLVHQPVYDHDLGFLIINSFLKGIETQETANTHLYERYAPIVLAAADSLATLFNPMVGTILSWPRHVKDYGGHNTIMDNMINLELLFWASRHGGNPLLYDVAVSHAKTTMQNHFRPDGSCYHVAVYDTLTGQFIKGVTHQGFNNGSMWSRGQSWAIYGYTMVYRYTQNPIFLDFAQKVADIYIHRLNGSYIPRWDFDAPGLDAPVDASAACVVASALLELSQYVKGEKAICYRSFAEKSLHQLSTEKYQSRERNVAFLMHSTGHHPAGTEIDASIIYADYYYIEALLRLKKLIESQKLK